MSDTQKYDVFVRTWWRRAKPEDGRWPNNLVPCPGKRRYLARNVSYSIAKQMCEEWNKEHKPGRYSRKAEFQSV